METRTRSTTVGTPVETKPEVADAPKTEELRPDQLVALDVDIKQLHTLHKDSKKAVAAYDKARKKLYKTMSTAGLKERVIDMGGIKLSAVLERSKLTTVDKDLLEELVGVKEAREIYSTSKTAVTEKFGEAIAEQVAVDAEGNENVTLKLE